LSADLRKLIQISFIKTYPVVEELSPADTQTDKLTDRLKDAKVRFRNSLFNEN